MVYNLTQTGKYAKIAYQELETMWVYPCPIISRTWDTQNWELHVHYGGGQLWNNLHKVKP